MGNATRIERETQDEFARRHIGPREAEIAAMLAEVGAGSLDVLIELAVPAPIRTGRPLTLPPARS